MNLKSFIFCDDIRQEVGRKHSLMGVYGDQMFVSVPDPTAPFAVRFAFYSSVQLDAGEQVPEMVRNEVFYNGALMLQHDAAINSGDPSRTIAAGISVPQLVLIGLGELSFRVSYYRGGSLVGGPFTHAVSVELPPG